MGGVRAFIGAVALGTVVLGADCARADDLPPPQIKRRSASAPDGPAPSPAPTRPAPAPTPARPAPVPASPPGGYSAWTTPPPGGMPVAPVRPAAPVRPSAPQAPSAPSARSIQRSVDTYLEGAPAQIGPSAAGSGVGYDDGFFLAGGPFRLRINATLQARYEAFLWDGPSPAPGGDRSGFSLPRATLKISGSAPCNMRYYAALDFGHHGARTALFQAQGCVFCGGTLGANTQSNNYDVLREAWIEWSYSKLFNVRMGQIGLATTRQLMTAPELQQFVDVSLASSWLGLGMPGYTDRNRDFGIAFHGAFGCNDEWSYLFTITNGDGADSIRNVLDMRTSDNLAYGGRLNWAFLRPTGYQEGALRQRTCEWYGELGAWGFYYADRSNRPFAVQGDFLRAGADLALGYGPVSLTGAFTYVNDADVVGGVLDDTSIAWLGQLGVHIPGTAFEIVARASGYDNEGPLLGNGSAMEFAGGINYYLNGHGNKLQLDAAWIDTSNGGFLVLDGYPGYANFLANGNEAWLIRFQWQLAI